MTIVETMKQYSQSHNNVMAIINAYCFVIVKIVALFKNCNIVSIQRTINYIIDPYCSVFCHLYCLNPFDFFLSFLKMQIRTTSTETRNFG